MKKKTFREEGLSLYPRPTRGEEIGDLEMWVKYSGGSRGGGKKKLLVPPVWKGPQELLDRKTLRIKILGTSQKGGNGLVTNFVSHSAELTSPIVD